MGSLTSISAIVWPYDASVTVSWCPRSGPPAFLVGWYDLTTGDQEYAAVLEVAAVEGQRVTLRRKPGTAVGGRHCRLFPIWRAGAALSWVDGADGPGRYWEEAPGWPCRSTVRLDCTAEGLGFLRVAG